MPQLAPFHFVNEFTVTVLGLGLLVVLVSYYQKKNLFRVFNLIKIKYYFLLDHLSLNNFLAYFLFCIVLVLICYNLYYSNISLISCFLFSFSLLISLLSSMFMSNIYKWSDNLLIRTIQKSILYSILSCVAIVNLNLVGVSFIETIYCDSGDEEEGSLTRGNNTKESSNNQNNQNVLEVKKYQGDDNKEYYKVEGNVEKESIEELGHKISEVIAKGIKDVIPNLGAAAAGGSIGSAMRKSTAALPSTQRMISGAVGALLGAGATKIGLEAGSAISKNFDLTKNIKDSQHADTDSEKIPSPEDTNFSINSPLEESGVPLLDLIDSIFNLNVIELIIIIFILRKKLPRWVLEIIIIATSSFIIASLLEYFGLSKPGESFSLFSLIYTIPYGVFTLKIYIILCSIISIYKICYFIVSYYLLFSEDKLSMPVYFPQFILNWISSVQKISKSEQKGIFLKIYFKLILFYFFVLILATTTYFFVIVNFKP